VLAGVVPQQGLLVLPLEAALCVGAGVRSAVGEDLVDPLLEVFHDQMILLLPVLVLGLWFEAAELAGMSCAEPIRILGQTLYVHHGGAYTSLPSVVSLPDNRGHLRQSQVSFSRYVLC